MSPLLACLIVFVVVLAAALTLVRIKYGAGHICLVWRARRLWYRLTTIKVPIGTLRTGDRIWIGYDSLTGPIASIQTIDYPDTEYPVCVRFEAPGSLRFSRDAVVSVRPRTRR